MSSSSAQLFGEVHTSPPAHPRVDDVTRSNPSDLHHVTTNGNFRSTRGRRHGPPSEAAEDLSATSSLLDIGESQGSLDALVQYHKNAVSAERSSSAVNVPLPGSTTASISIQSESTTAGASESRPVPIYLKDIKRLGRYMPHLQNVAKASRAHHHAELTCYDYSRRDLVSEHTYKLDSNNAKSKSEFARSITDDIPSGIDCRLLVVDDLSDTLIQILGSHLRITPECFEEHLLNSGWHSSEYRDRGAELWSTHNHIKDYASIKWFRPIKERVARPFEGRKSSAVLDPCNLEHYVEPRSTRDRYRHSASPLVNILRRPWEVKLGPGGFSAWEERATVWKSRIKNCEIVLLLLDPLPIVRHSVEIEEIPTAYLPDRTASPSSPRRDVESTPIPEPQKYEGWRNPTRHSDENTAQSHDRHDDICMFVDSLSRLLLVDYHDILSPERWEWLDSEIVYEKSTADALKEAVQSSGTRVANPVAPDSAFECLLKIVLHDTTTIIRSIDLALNDMDLNMLDDELLQSKIDQWRRTLNRFESELRDMKTSLPKFAEFATAPREGATDMAVEKRPGNCMELLHQCTIDITKAQERRRVTHGSLMTAMSLVESKRGISEAESVTKLTELAFFFIPLTFAASLFSMQVRELDGTASVGVFFAVALTITVCSYALRLVIRSSSFLRLWRRWKENIRTTSGTPSGVPIATSAFFKWGWEHFRPHFHILYVVLPTAAILAALWTYSLQQGIQLGVTIALLMLGLVVVLMTFFIRLEISTEWARRFVPRNSRTRFLPARQSELDGVS